MSDPFASFNDTPATGEDPAIAAFLAREKEEFEKIEAGSGTFANDDFGSFGSLEAQAPTAASSNIFAPSSDDFSTATINPTSSQSTLSDGLFNTSTTNFNDTSSSVPNFTLSNDDALETKKDSPYSAISQVDRLQQEPEKIKKWREEQRERIEKKDREEELKKNEWKEIAKKELEDWYKNRNEQLEKTKEINKTSEAEFCSQRDSLATGQEWDRVSKLCDFNPKSNKNTKDVSRMRSILLQLKQQPLIRNK